MLASDSTSIMITVILTSVIGCSMPCKCAPESRQFFYKYQWCWASWQGILRRRLRWVAVRRRFSGRYVGREGRCAGVCGRSAFCSACFPGPGTPSCSASRGSRGGRGVRGHGRCEGDRRNPRASQESTHARSGAVRAAVVSQGRITENSRALAYFALASLRALFELVSS